MRVRKAGKAQGVKADTGEKTNGGRRATAALKLARAAGAALLSLAAFGYAGGCEQYQAPDANLVRIQRPERVGAAGTPAPAPKRDLPDEDARLPRATRDTRVDPVLGEPEVLRLPLQEAIQRAVVNNSEVRVAGYEPAIEETRIEEAEARFDPAFVLAWQAQQQDILSPTQSLSATDPFNPSGFRTYSFEVGVEQLLESGAQFRLGYNLQRIKRTNEGAFGFSVNPYNLAELSLRLTQPLLRDFGTAVNRARITIAQNNQRISVLEFRRTLEDNLTELEQTYWRLSQATEEQEIQRELVEFAAETRRRLEARRIAGVNVTRVHTALAASIEAGRRSQFREAEGRVADLSDELKRRMNDADLPVAGPTLVLPADAPLTEPVDFELYEQIDAAMDNRLELGQQQLRIESAGTALRVAENNILPELNFQTQLSFQGPGDDFGEAIQSQWGFDDFNYSLGLEFRIPFGNAAARAIQRRAKLQRLQAIEEYRNLVNQIGQDVKAAWRAVSISWANIYDLRLARLEAQDSLAAQENRLFKAEVITPEALQNLFIAQERLGTARAQEAQAIANYNIAIARLERAKGTLLRYNNVLIEEEPFQQARR